MQEMLGLIIFQKKDTMRRISIKRAVHVRIEESDDLWERGKNILINKNK
jgi:hypothetical protein